MEYEAWEIGDYFKRFEIVLCAFCMVWYHTYFTILIHVEM
jgi:hypothetical protein